MRIINLLLLALFCTGCQNFDSSIQPKSLTDAPVVIFIYGLNGQDKGGLWYIQEDVAKARPDMNLTRMYWNDTYADPPGLLPGVTEDSRFYKLLKPGQKIILVGHSFGGDKCVELCNAYKSKGLQIEELILLDPVPRTHAGFLNILDYKIPSNVKKTTCIYRRAIIPPYSCYVRSSETPYENIRIPLTGHGLGISTHPDRQDLVTDKIIGTK